MKKTTGQLFGQEFTPNSENKIIVGIDPGIRFLGIGIIEIDDEIINTIQINKKKQPEATTLIPYIIQYTHKLLQIKQQRETTEKLHFIYETITQIIETYKPNLIIVEDSFVGINKNSAIKLGITRGSILTAIGKYKIKTESIPPKQIKMEITNNGTAQKEDIEEFFQNNMKNWSNIKKLDSTDALAAAFCGIKHFVL